MAGSEVSLVEIVNAGIGAALDGVYVARPGRVTAYDALTNTAVVKPMVKRAVYDVDDDERSFEELPEIPFVPIVFPRCGEFVVTLPVVVGDTVLLIFSDVSMGEWRESGQISEPVDARRHSIGWPSAIPGLFADSSPMSQDPVDVAARIAGMILGQHAGGARIEISPGEIKLGKDATDFVALASQVDASFTAIKDAFAAWTVVANDGGAALKTAWGTKVASIVATGASMTKAK